MDCNQEQIHAYYDGELAPRERAAVELHLTECADCRELLADLQSVSQFIASAPMVDMPPQAMKRMQQAWWAAQDRGVLRIASWLTAAAAAVIFAAVIFSPSQRPDATLATAGSNWQMVALTPPTPVEDEPQQQDEVIDAAQWIANDLALAMR
jgi:anti-sigma factor RsiW